MKAIFEDKWAFKRHIKRLLRAHHPLDVGLVNQQHRPSGRWWRARGSVTEENAAALGGGIRSAGTPGKTGLGIALLVAGFFYEKRIKHLLPALESDASRRARSASLAHRQASKSIP